MSSTDFSPETTRTSGWSTQSSVTTRALAERANTLRLSHVGVAGVQGDVELAVEEVDTREIRRRSDAPGDNGVDADVGNEELRALALGLSMDKRRGADTSFCVVNKTIG